MKKLTVDISYDGKTSHRVPTRQTRAGWVGTVVHPGAPGFASPRASATDSRGGTVTQTIPHAYRLR